WRPWRLRPIPAVARWRSSSGAVRRRLRGGAQRDPESAALTLLRFQADRAAHALHRLAHNAQADAGAVVLAGGMELVEDAEDALEVLGRDADALVLEPEADHALLPFP